MTSEAHLIEGTKDTADLFRTQIITLLMVTVCKITGLPAHLLTHSTSGTSFTMLLVLACCSCYITDTASACTNSTTSQPSLNTLIAAHSTTPELPSTTLLHAEEQPYEMALPQPTHAHQTTL